MTKSSTTTKKTKRATERCIMCGLALTKTQSITFNPIMSGGLCTSCGSIVLDNPSFLTGLKDTFKGSLSSIGSKFGITQDLSAIWMIINKVIKRVPLTTAEKDRITKYIVKDTIHAVMVSPIGIYTGIGLLYIPLYYLLKKRTLEQLGVPASELPKEEENKIRSNAMAGTLKVAFPTLLLLLGAVLSTVVTGGAAAPAVPVLVSTAIATVSEFIAQATGEPLTDEEKETLQNAILHPSAQSVSSITSNPATPNAVSKIIEMVQKFFESDYGQKIIQSIIDMATRYISNDQYTLKEGIKDVASASLPTVDDMGVIGSKVGSKISSKLSSRAGSISLSNPGPGITESEPLGSRRDRYKFYDDTVKLILNPTSTPVNPEVTPEEDIADVPLGSLSLGSRKNKARNRFLTDVFDTILNPTMEDWNRSSGLDVVVRQLDNDSQSYVTRYDYEHNPQNPINNQDDNWRWWEYAHIPAVIRTGRTLSDTKEIHKTVYKEVHNIPVIPITRNEYDFLLENNVKGDHNSLDYNALTMNVVVSIPVSSDIDYLMNHPNNEGLYMYDIPLHRKYRYKTSSFDEKPPYPIYVCRMFEDIRSDRLNRLHNTAPDIINNTLSNQLKKIRIPDPKPPQGAGIRNIDTLNHTTPQHNPGTINKKNNQNPKIMILQSVIKRVDDKHTPLVGYVVEVLHDGKWINILEHPDTINPVQVSNVDTVGVAYLNEFDPKLAILPGGHAFVIDVHLPLDTFIRAIQFNGYKHENLSETNIKPKNYQDFKIDYFQVKPDVPIKRYCSSVYKTMFRSIDPHIYGSVQLVEPTSLPSGIQNLNTNPTQDLEYITPEFSSLNPTPKTLNREILIQEYNNFIQHRNNQYENKTQN